MGFLQRVFERYRYLRPVLASLGVALIFFIVFLLGKGYDLLFGESEPFPYAFEGLTYGEFGAICVYLLIILMAPIGWAIMAKNEREAKNKKK